MYLNGKLLPFISCDIHLFLAFIINIQKHAAYPTYSKKWILSTSATLKDLITKNQYHLPLRHMMNRMFIDSRRKIKCLFACHHWNVRRCFNNKFTKYSKEYLTKTCYFWRKTYHTKKYTCYWLHDVINW